MCDFYGTIILRVLLPVTPIPLLRIPFNNIEWPLQPHKIHVVDESHSISSCSLGPLPRACFSCRRMDGQLMDEPSSESIGSWGGWTDDRMARGRRRRDEQTALGGRPCPSIRWWRSALNPSWALNHPGFTPRSFKRHNNNAYFYPFIRFHIPPHLACQSEIHSRFVRRRRSGGRGGWLFDIWGLAGWAPTEVTDRIGV